MRENYSGDAWVVFLDVFGFSAIVNSAGNSPQRVFLSLDDVQSRLLRKVRKSKAPPYVFSFSDSTFLVYPIRADADPASVLHVCWEDVTRAQTLFLNQPSRSRKKSERGPDAVQFPLRGGISRGTVMLGHRSVIGQPVLDAVRYESMIDFPLVLLPQAELRKGGTFSDFTARMTLLPVKGGGRIRAAVVGPENRSYFRLYAGRRMRETATVGPYEVASAWEQTMDVLAMLEGKADD